MWRSLARSFVFVGIVALLFLRGGTHLMADTGAPTVEKFIASISAAVQRERKAEMDFGAEAATVFRPGRPVAEYDPDLRRLGFTRNDIIFKGRDVAIYSKVTDAIGVLGNHETRVILYLSRDGEIESVEAKYFFHTL
jgi:hypothetical protein